MHNRRPQILLLLGCLLLAAFGQSVFATTAIIPGDDVMVVESRAIVTGRVIGLSTRVDNNTERVYTYIRLELDAVLKGTITDREIVLKELGGETRDHGTLIFGMPRFELGQQVLLYLNTWPDGALRVHQGFIGKFNINIDASTGRLVVERRLEDPNVVIMAGSGNGTNRSELDAYTQMVSDLAAANRKKMRAFEQKYYSGVPMLIQPTELQSPQAGEEITPQWVLLNPTSPSRWFEPDSNQPVVFYVNPTGAPSFAQFPADVQTAMDAWSTAGGSIRVNYGGTTTGCGVQLADGMNTISFNNCDSFFSASQSCAGLLAVSGIIRYIPTQTKTVGGTTYGKAVEANMSFNPYGLCNFTNRCDLQEVATHEMGHALGLGHSTDPNATMFPYVHFDNRCAGLMPDDIQGITAIYPGSSGGARLTIMTADLPTGSVNADYSARLQASGGSGGYRWSLASGQLPSGMQLGTSGLLYGSTGISGNFNFTAQVVDSAGNASQKLLYARGTSFKPGADDHSLRLSKEESSCFGAGLPNQRNRLRRWRRAAGNVRWDYFDDRKEKTEARSTSGLRGQSRWRAIEHSSILVELVTGRGAHGVVETGIVPVDGGCSSFVIRTILEGNPYGGLSESNRQATTRLI